MITARNSQGIAQGVLLIALALCTIVLFVLTTLVINAYTQLESRLGAEWYDRGTRDLHAGNAEQAVIDLRTALSYSREVTYRLELARALTAAGRTREAREYLLSLWEQKPGSAELNLELARVSAISQAIPAAIGYYDAAISGAWDTSPELNRRNTRLELARFLVAHNDKRRALAVLAPLASDLPPDAQLRTDVGTLLLEAGDSAAARRLFDAALQTTHDYLPAIQGAGEAAFASNDFAAAARYLGIYVREHPEDQIAHSLLDTASTALEIDPLLPKLSAAERRTRAIRLFHEAEQRVGDCAAKIAAPQPPQDLQAAASRLASQAANANQPRLRANPDLIEDLFTVSATAVAASSKWCGARPPMDQAVAALAQLHGVRP